MACLCNFLEVARGSGPRWLAPSPGAVLASRWRRPRAQRSLTLQGIFISRVSEEGPAARAGVRVGDKLLEVSRGP